MKTLFEKIKKSDKRIIYPQMGGMGLALTDYTMFEVYADSEKQLEIAEKIEKTFPTDFTYTVDFGMIFQDTLGFPMKKPDRDFPSTAEHLIKEESDIKAAPLLNMDKDGLFPEYFNSMKKISNNIKKPHMVAVMGPLTLACELGGMEHVLRASVKNSVYFQDIVEYASKLIHQFVLLAIENGATVVQISEPVMSVINPNSYRKKVLHELQSIIEKINEHAISALHVCGDTSKYLPLMVESGSEILGIDQIMDMEWVMQNVPENIWVAGNIDPVEVMLNGTKEEAYNATKQLLRKMEKYDNYMVSFGCDCPVDTPIDNMLAVINAVNETKKQDTKE